ncbi:polysaccharide biosynthesis/export family protein [Rhodopirellula sallentina]|uniref:Polysaccharide biosynthesis protein n=1 Tax=Rhodopirellula sallentina SM41 TaxID=1263870 RepID=M5UR98_9BACT|nr:polysaccharide biosynthesis/export family protein [Rhodopirellula sallentina]EMI58518.1 polysaccharide biosynthesis protein [Rhodopirellula sallentina SM41]
MNFNWKGVLLAAVLTPMLTGCTSFFAPISGVPVNQIPPQLLGEKRADYINVPLALLRMEQPEDYLIDEGDILGIYIEGVMPPQANEDQPVAIPPVHFPEEGSDLPPSVGFPIPVRDDGTLPLPLIEPLDVRGKTITEVENMVRKAYVDDEKILRKGRDRILVSLMRERTQRVIVIREDGGSNDAAIAGGSRQFGNAQEVISGTERQGAGYTLDMPAYKNDLMHALAETGGLPGLNAKSEVKVLKASRFKGKNREEMMMQLFAGRGPMDGCCFDMCGGCGMVGVEGMVEDPFSVTIPLRVRPGEMPQIDPADVILEDGDIVYIEARDTEVFYTGGLLPGGQYPLPRDYDLDVIGAMSVAGTGLGGSVQGSGSGGGAAGALLGGGFGGATPTQLYVMRKGPCGQEFTIAVDLKKAYNNPNEKILVQPGDTLILRYKPHEEALNFGIVAFFTYGIRELFN